MNITYLFLMISVVSIIGSVASILNEDYRVLPFLLFFSIGGIVAFIQIRKEESTPCRCESFWNIDGLCFRCGGCDPSLASQKNQSVKH